VSHITSVVLQQDLRFFMLMACSMLVYLLIRIIMRSFLVRFLVEMWMLY